jgi:hypothetical protein
MQDTLETFTEALKDYYQDRLVDPDMYPSVFNYQVRVFMYIKKITPKLN